MSASKRPAPERGGLSEQFWVAVDSGRLLLQRCSGCEELRYPVNAICPRCLSDDYVWDEVSGGGEVHSTIVFHQVYDEAFREQVPYNVSVIQLDEGPRMVSNVVGIDPSAVAVGDRVAVRFDPVDGMMLPRFEPAAGAADG